MCESHFPFSRKQNWWKITKKLMNINIWDYKLPQKYKTGLNGFS